MTVKKISNKQIIIMSFFLSIFVILTWFVFNLRIEHDEAEHIHNAFLISKGLTPFYDFYEHHMPLLWYILSIPFDFGLNTFAAIVFARSISLISILCTFFILYKIIKVSKINKITLVIFALIQVIPLSVDNLYFVVRPEVFSLPFFSMAIYLLLKAQLTDSYNEKTKKYILLTICLTLLCGFSPRSYFFIIGVIIFILKDYKNIGLKNIAMLGGIFSICPILIISIFGFKNILGYVLMFSATDTKPFNWFNTYTYYPILFLVIFSILISLYILLTRVKFPFFNQLAIINLLCLITPFIERHPYRQTVTYGLLTTSIILGCLVSYFYSINRPQFKKIIYIVFIIWFFQTYVLFISEGFFSKEIWVFKQNIAYKSALSNLLKGQTVLCNPIEHPIETMDATYFGYGADHTKRLSEIPILQNKIKYIKSINDDVYNKKPVLISKYYLNLKDTKMNYFISEQYFEASWDLDLLIRKDFYEKVVQIYNESFNENIS